jgi:aspartyl-tRNA(Asn)/glutamyl-tRNA(Gln) amidotransferase subunit A
MTADARAGDLALTTVASASRALAARELTSVELTERCLASIAARDGALNAFIAVLTEPALAQARAADREIASGHHRGPLHGIPLSLKDLFDLEGTPTTAASRVRANHVAPRDALIVARLRAAGAVFIGKTNLHEFAFGTTNEDSAFGPAHHPSDASRSPGGSSGGSAASVVAGMALASLGTDTGGSIRIPAAACGLVGLKPAYGDLPLDGVVPLSSTLDHAGPICRSVEDAALLCAAMGGYTPPPPATVALKGLRLGVLRGYFTAALDPEVARAFDTACAQLQDGGAILEDVEIRNAGDVSPIYLHIVLSEAAAFHAKTLESRAEDYTPNVRVRLEVGRYLLAEDYVRALRGREVLRREVDEALTGRAGLILPSLPIPAPKLGVPTVRLAGVEEPVRNVMLRLTQLFNITGHPAISLPLSSTAQLMPTGLQLVGHAGATSALLATARAIEPQVGPGRSG